MDAIGVCHFGLRNLGKSMAGQAHAIIRGSGDYPRGHSFLLLLAQAREKLGPLARGRRDGNRGVAAGRCCRYGAKVLSDYLIDELSQHISDAVVSGDGSRRAATLWLAIQISASLATVSPWCG